MSVHDRDISDPQRGCRVVQVNLHALRRDGNRPEQAVRSDPRAVVVDLLQYIGRSNWTGINVQSDEAKGAVMVAAILADVFTLHETDVGLERERHRQYRAHPRATKAPC